MTTTNHSISKERLTEMLRLASMATQGPWTDDYEGMGTSVECWLSSKKKIFITLLPVKQTAKDCKFIASVDPTTIRALIEELLRYRKNDVIVSGAKGDQLKLMDQELREAREVIGFYASQDNWCGYHREVDTITNDSEKAKASDDFDILLGGNRARAHLAKWGSG